MQALSAHRVDGRRAMKIARITVSVIVALLKGEVVTVDKASKKIGIKLSGTVGSSDATRSNAI
jgi:hypothetical protein